MKSIRVFCPGTIANVSCGFDVLGLSLAGVGDYMTVTQTTIKGITISEILGQDLPMETTQNVAGVAGLALLEALGSDAGIALKINQRI